MCHYLSNSDPDNIKSPLYFCLQTHIETSPLLNRMQLDTVYSLIYHISYIIYHIPYKYIYIYIYISYIIYHTSYIIYHIYIYIYIYIHYIYISYIIYHISFIIYIYIYHISYIIYHIAYSIYHISYVICHMSYIIHIYIMIYWCLFWVTEDVDLCLIFEDDARLAGALVWHCRDTAGMPRWMYGVRIFHQLH